MHQTIFLLLLFGLFFCQHAIGQQITVSKVSSKDVLAFADNPTKSLVQIILKENNDKHIIDLLTFQVNGQPPSENAKIDCILLESGACTSDVNPTITEDKISVNALDHEKYSSLNLTLIDQDATYSIYLTTKNENDEDPNLILDSCTIMENDEEGKCKLTVSDADGSLNKLKFTIQDLNTVEDGYLAEECFKIDEISVDDTTYTTETALSLIKPLDYEVRLLYEFNIIVHDGDRPNIFSFTFNVTVGDENDNPPEWITSDFTFQIEEEKEEGYTFNIQAKDGDHGLNNEIEYIIEDNNYATINNINGTIIMSKIDRDGPPTIDEILLKVTAREKEDITSSITETLTILVLDINDNSAEFDKPLYEVTIDEVENLNIIVSDIDLGDNAMYTIEITNQSQSADQVFDIVPKEGRGETSIRVIVKDTKFLDYKKHPSYTFTLKSIGTNDPTKIATADVNIFPTDINDEPPQFVTTNALLIPENSNIGTVVGYVQATDEDLTANLEIKINWQSTKATKNENDVDFSNYIGFIDIIVISNDENNIEAILTINEVIEGNTPDFEVFDTVYLVVQVIDKETEEGENMTETTMIFNIKNLNDNKPEFDSTQNKFQVVENSPTGTLIDIIEATDADNLQKLVYTLTFQNDEDQKLIQFDKNTGRLHTTDKPIDCDDPKQDNIIIYVTADDGEHTSDQFEIAIYIIDQNDNAPTLEGDVITIEEDFYGKDSTNNGKLIYTLNVQDNDRDDAYNAKSVHCFILNNDNNYFDIKNDIELYVDLKNGKTLDRELIEEYKISVQCYDSKNGGLQLDILNPPEFTIILSDVNDWTPTIFETDTILTDENVKEDTSFPNIIQAEDKDQGKNSKIIFYLFAIRHCQEVTNECTALNETDYMFDLTADNNDDKSVQLKVNRNLETLYGKYEVDIKVEDMGKPPLSSQSTINVEIQKYNFKAPEIISPRRGTYYLNTMQKKGSPLELSVEGTFPELIVTDGQGDKFEFDFKFESLDLNKFIQADTLNSKGTLIWIGNEAPDEYVEHTVNITATILDAANINGQQPLGVTKSYTFVFFSVSESEPCFSEPYTFTFEVNENVIDVNQTIPPAAYPSITSNSSIYYLLKEIDDYFNVDIETGTITSKKSIDFEVEHTHQFNIYASNKDTIKEKPDEKSILSVTVNVNDINDNEPKFENGQYYASVSVKTAVNTVITKITATDIDTVGSNLDYSIDEEQLPSNVEEKSYFLIDQNSGEISLASEITQTMEGAFDLKVCATDEAPESHKTCTSLKIFIVKADNTVNFNFNNNEKN